MTEQLITYPLTADPMKPPPELEAPQNPAVGGVQVYLHDGAFFVNQTDLSVAALFRDIRWTRHWRGDAKFDNGGLLGHGWDFGFNKRIVPIAFRTLPNGLLAERVGVDKPKLMYYNGTGRAELYAESLDSPSEDRRVRNFDKEFRAYVTTYQSPPGQFHEIQRYVVLGPPSDHPFAGHPNVEPTELIFYVLREKDGTRFVFNCRGQLIYILSRNDNNDGRGTNIRIDLRYDGPFNPLTQNRMLSKIFDATGRAYSIDSSVNIGRGRIFTNVDCVLKAGQAPIPRIKRLVGAGIAVEYKYRNADTEPVLESVVIKAAAASPREWQYKYNADNLITDVKDPNESAKGRLGKSFLHNEYAGNRVRVQTLGDSASPERQQITLQYQAGAFGFFGPTSVIETDAGKNKRAYRLQPAGSFRVTAELTVTDARPDRNGGPWTTRYRHNRDTQVTEITYPKGNGITFVYDETNTTVKKGPIRDKLDEYTYGNNLARGNLLSITKHGAASGGTVTRDPGIAYSGPSSSMTSQRYDELYNQIIEARDARGHITKFVIDDWDTHKHRGNPREVHYPAVRQPTGATPASIERPVHKLTYDEYAQRATVEEMGDKDRTTTYDYHEKTRYLWHVRHPGGAFETIEAYDELGNIKERLTQDGKVSLQLDGFGQVRRKTVDPDGYALVTEYDYDHNGNTTEIRVEVKDTFGEDGTGDDPQRLGLRTAASYMQVRHIGWDILNRKTKVTTTGNGLSIASCYRYGPGGDLDRAIEPALNGKNPMVTMYSYDARHLPTRVVEFGASVEAGTTLGAAARQSCGVDGARAAPTDSAERRTTERRYDGNGNVEMVRITTGTDVIMRTAHYNGLDRVDKSVDPLKAERHFVYDEAGNVVDLTIKSVNGTLLHHVKSEFDAYDHLIHERVAALRSYSQYEEADAVLRWFYSKHLTLARTVSANGAETKYQHDLQDRVWRVADSLGSEIENRYGFQGTLESVTVKGTTNFFDGTKRLVTTRNSIVDWANTKYDRINRIIKVIRPGTAERRFLDSLGRTRATITNARQLTTFMYDGLGRQVEIKTALSSATTKYTAGGLVEETESPDGHFKMTYDSLGRLRKREDVRSGGSTTFDYKNGRRIETIDPNGTRVVTTYNAAGLPLEVARVHVSASATKVLSDFPVGQRAFALVQGTTAESFEYDELGRVTRVSTPHTSEVRRAYDGRDRIVEERQKFGVMEQIVTYRYGHRWTEVTYPEKASGLRVTFASDMLGRIESVRADDRDVGSYIYTGIDRVARRRLANGVETRFAYDQEHRLTDVEIARDGPQPGGHRMWTASATYDVATGMTRSTREVRPRQDGRPDVVLSTDVQFDPFGRQIAKVKSESSRNAGTSVDLVSAIGASFSHYEDRGTVLKSSAEFSGLAPRAGTHGGIGARISEWWRGGDAVHSVRVDRFTYDPKTRHVEEVRTHGGFEGALPKTAGDLGTVSEALIGALQKAAQAAKRPASGTQKFEYDRNGNLISDGRYVYAYDFKNRLVTVQDRWSVNGLHERVSFAYDGFDRRIQITPGAVVRPDALAFHDRDKVFAPNMLVYDGASVIVEIGTPWSPDPYLASQVKHSERLPSAIGRYVYGARPGELLRIDRRPEAEAAAPLTSFYPHEDLDGVIRFVTNAEGRLLTIENESPIGEGKKGSDQAAGAQYMVEGTDIRVPYLASNTRIDGFAGITYRDDTKQPTVDYRSAANFVRQTERGALQDARRALQDQYQTAALAAASLPMIVAIGPEILAARGLGGEALRGAVSGYGIGVGKSAVTGHWISTELLEGALHGAVLGMGTGLMGKMGLSAAVGRLGEDVITGTAVGTALDVAVDGASLGDALGSNVLRSVFLAGASRGIGWVAPRIKSAFLGTATDAAEALPRLPSAVREEASSIGGALESCSFAGGAHVLTDEGRKNIEHIRTGTLVWSRDPVTMEEGFKRVTMALSSRNAELMRLRFRRVSDPSFEPNEPPLFDAPAIVGTATHPFWSETRNDWVPMDRLLIGERLWLATGDVAEIVELETHRAPGSEIATYNLEVADWHTYFVGAGDDGRFVWVHNTGWRCFARGALGGSLERAWRAIERWEAAQNRFRRAIQEFPAGRMTPERLQRLREERFAFRMEKTRFGTEMHAVRARVLGHADIAAEVKLPSAKRMDEFRAITFEGRSALYIGDLVARFERGALSRPSHIAKGFEYMFEVAENVPRNPNLNIQRIIYEEFYYRDPNLRSALWIMSPGEVSPRLHSVRVR